MENITKQLSSLADEYAKLTPFSGLKEREVYTEVMGQLEEFFSLNPNDEQLQTIGKYLSPFIKDGVDYTELFQESRPKVPYKLGSIEDSGSILRAQMIIYKVINDPKSMQASYENSSSKSLASIFEIWQRLSNVIMEDIEGSISKNGFCLKKKSDRGFLEMN